MPTIFPRLIKRLPILLALLALTPQARAAEEKPIQIRVVIVTTFEIGKDTGDIPGEFQDWVERFPLRQILPFPQGFHELRYDPDRQVLGIVVGEGKSHAAASITALGYDPRFDLSKAYWILAGIAGIDPAIGSTGSAAWARFVVDGDLAYEIDTREIPADWPTGIIPYNRHLPFQEPAPPAVSSTGEQYFALNAGLADWAYRLTADVKLPDNAHLQAMRARFPTFPNAQKPPFVLEADTLTCDRFWLGTRMNAWAQRWVSYWTKGKGTFATSAEEDTGYVQALTFLSHAGRIDFNRVTDLRTASDYSVEPAGKTPAQLLESEETSSGHEDMAFSEAVESAYLVGRKFVGEIATHWDKYADHIPTAKP